jgi:hypothetical protein
MQGGYGGYGGYPPPPQQGGWQQHPAPMQQQPMPMAPQPKKGGGGAVIALVVILFLLIGGGAAAVGAYLYLLAKPGPHLARYVPKSASLYVELPGFKHSLLSAATMKPLDSSRVDDKLLIQDLDLAFARSFTLPQPDAHAVVAALDAGAFVARDTNTHGQAALLISFTDASAVDKLLHSSRFAESGPFVGGGVRYTLLARSPYDIPPNAGPTETALSFMETGTGTSTQDLVWFAKKKLLVYGDDQMVTDMGAVIDGGADSLEKNEVYTKAKKTFESGADIAFFFDTHDFDDSRDPATKKMLEGYLQNRDPLTGAVKLVKAGVMMDMHATLTGTSLPPETLVAPAGKLAFPHELPSDTVAYMAMSTKTKMSGVQVRNLLIKTVEDNDPTAGRELRSGLDEIERKIGFKLDDLVDMTGDEAALALVLDPAFKLDTTNGIMDELASFGVVYAIATKDDAKAKMILGKLRAQLETPDMAKIVKIAPVGTDGWEADPQTVTAVPIPNLTVKYDGKRVVVVLASPTITKRTFDALYSNTLTLKGNQAHELAFGALPQDANFYMWLDTGRITSIMMDGASHARKTPTRTMLPIEAIRLTGNDHVTSALAMKLTVKSGQWTMDLDSLNLPAMALFEVAKDVDLSTAMPSGPIFGPGTSL